MQLLSRVALCAVLAVSATPLGAQTLTRVAPDAASPGDVLVLRGSGFQSVATLGVSFRATVGGFLGVSTQFTNATVLSDTVATVRLPQMAGFAPPTATPPGNPNGRIAITGSTLPFFFLQGTFDPDTNQSPQTSTLGTGTTQSTGFRAAASFLVANGPPLSGNQGFVLEIENAVANTTAVAVLGSPAIPLWIPIGDGTLVLDLAKPYVILPSVTTDAAGDASFALPIPPVVGATVFLAAQWVVVDGGAPAVSKALQFAL